MVKRMITISSFFLTALISLPACSDRGATITSPTALNAPPTSTTSTALGDSSQAPTNTPISTAPNITATPSTPAITSNVVISNSTPCKNIKKACENAGYVKGGRLQGKGLLQQCMGPILAGQQIPGVAVNPIDVQSCQQKKAAAKAAKATGNAVPQSGAVTPQ